MDKEHKENLVEIATLIALHGLLSSGSEPEGIDLIADFAARIGKETVDKLEKING